MSNRSRIVLVIAIFFGSVVNASEPKPESEFAEPELELNVEIDGKEHPAKIDQQLSIEVDGKQIALTIRSKSYRTLRLSDIEFRYPRHMSFEVDRDSAPIVIWTLDGNNAVIILQRYPKWIGDFSSSVIEGLEEQYGTENVKKKETTLVLEGKRSTGTQLDIKLLDLGFLRQEVFNFDAGKYGYVVILQDSLTDEGDPTEEMTAVKKMLRDSLKLKQAP